MRNEFKQKKKRKKDLFLHSFSLLLSVLVWFVFYLYSKTDEFFFIVIIDKAKKAKSHTRKTVESIKYLRNNY